jgi:hypothetical protein
MIKKILTMSTIASSFLFVSPCYAMFCCCGGDEEEERSSLTHTTQSQNFQEQERQKKEAQKQKEEEERNRKEAQKLEEQAKLMAIIATQEVGRLQRKASQLRSALPQEQKEESQAMTLLSLPKILSGLFTSVSTEEGVQTLALRDSVYVLIYDSYDDALSSNTELQKVHQTAQVLNKKSAAQRGMQLFYKDMRTKGGTEDQDDIEQFILLCEKIMGVMPEEHPPVKFGQDLKTQRSLLLIRMDNGAFFAKGPAAPTEENRK